MSQFDIKMTPTPGDEYVYIPITLDTPRVNGWKRYRGRLILGVISTLLLTVLCVGLLFAGGGSLLLKLLLVPILWYFGFMAIRVFILEERRYRKDLEHFYNSQVDFRLPELDLWGIFSIEQAYPYYCHFVNGQIGMFVLFEKNVRVGNNTDEIRYQHYQAVADAYRVAGRAKLNLMHIDHMTSFGDAARINNLYTNLETCDNNDLRGLLETIYHHLEEQSQYNSSAYDVYLLSCKGTPEELWNGFSEFQRSMLEANYLSLNIMDESSVRNLVLSLFNLEKFSTSEASAKLIKTSQSVVKPVALVHVDGSRTLIK